MAPSGTVQPKRSVAPSPPRYGAVRAVPSTVRPTPGTPPAVSTVTASLKRSTASTRSPPSHDPSSGAATAAAMTAGRASATALPSASTATTSVAASLCEPRAVPTLSARTHTRPSPALATRAVHVRPVSVSASALTATAPPPTRPALTDSVPNPVTASLNAIRTPKVSVALRPCTLSAGLTAAALAGPGIARASGTIRRRRPSPVQIPPSSQGSMARSSTVTVPPPAGASVSAQAFSSPASS